MPVSPAEREYLLSQIGRFAETDLNNLWRQAEQLDTEEFFSFVRDGFVEVATTYHQTTGQLAATWFEESDPLSPYLARVADPVTPERLIKSAEWALGGDGEQALSRMQGSMQRAVYDGARDTVVLNAEATRSRWIRVTRANACEFCRMLATRSGDYAYLSREAAEVVTGQRTRNRRTGARKMGSKFHDSCYCTAVEVRDGQAIEDVLDEEKLKLYQQWTDEYEKAVANAGSTDTKKVMAAWREQTASSPLTPQVPKIIDRAVLDNAATVEEIGNFLRTNHGLNVDKLVNSPLNQGTTVQIPSIMGGAPQTGTVEPLFVDIKVAREYAQGVDDMLVKYPYLKLDGVDADWHPTGDPNVPAFASPKVENGEVVGAQRITIGPGFADPEGKIGQAWQSREDWMNSDSYDAGYKKAAVGRPIYKTAVHEMGHDMDYTGGQKARRTAGLALRDYIVQTPGAVKIREKILAGESKTGLGAFERLYGSRFEITPEYEAYERKWLRQNIVSAYSFRDSDRKKSVLNMAEALAEAFTDVELRGEEATEASKIMYAELIKAAEEATRP